MIAFNVFLSDGSPAVDTQVIIMALGETQYGITDRQGFVQIPVSNNSGKIIIRGKTVHYGDLNISNIQL